MLYCLGTAYTLALEAAGPGSDLERNLLAFKDALGPQFSFDNMFRCLVFASFILIGMFVKTVLTVGFADTLDKISRFNAETAEQLVTGDKYLRNSLARAVLNTFFLVIAWTLIGIAYNKKPTFQNNSRKKSNRRRRRRQTLDHHLSDRTLAMLQTVLSGNNKFV